MASLTGASLVLIFAVCVAGILLSALPGRKRALLVIAIAGTLTSLLMVLTAATVLATGQSYHAALWTLDGFGRLTLRIDPLSSIFLLAAGIVYFSISLFVKNFIDDQPEAAYSAQRYGVLYFALMASVVLILVAGDALLFLISLGMHVDPVFPAAQLRTSPNGQEGGLHHACDERSRLSCRGHRFPYSGPDRGRFVLYRSERGLPVFRRKRCGACFCSGFSDLGSRRAWFPSISGSHGLTRRRRLSSSRSSQASRSILVSTEFCGSTPTCCTRVAERALLR